ncbi:MAG: cupin domain-containing protein, partial [Gemmataceae bacterium]|nr:cupin domain-containing protein [Gemmataceae bacterium]
FITNGHRDRIFNAYRATLVEKELKKLHARGGLIGGTGTGSAVLGDLVIDRANEDRLTEPGLGLLSQWLVEDGSASERIADALAAHPAHLALELQRDSAVIIRGENMRVLGKAPVAIHRAGKEAKAERLKPGAELDLGQLRRAAVPEEKKSKSTGLAGPSSRLVRAADSVPTTGNWGEWRRYFREDTHSTKDMVVLAVHLKPGHEPHPPHQHAEEEFMLLAEGSGTWHLDGKEMPARKSDVLYAAPWSMHGLKNTSDSPLTYYLVKWNSKGAPTPKPGECKAPINAKGPTELAVLRGHTNSVTSIALTANGRTLISGSLDETIRIWDVVAGKQRGTLRGSNGRVDFVAITPDGKTLASADQDGVIKLWDVAACRERMNLTAPKRRPCVLLTLTPDGRTLASLSSDNKIELWDIATGRLQADLACEANRFWSQALSPDAKLFAWGDRFFKKALRLWVLPSGIDRSPPWDGKDIAPQIFSADGKTLIIIIHSEDTIQLREVATGMVRSQIHKVGENDLQALAFHPAGRILAWCYRQSKTIKLWDVVAGQPAGELHCVGRGVNTLVFSADGGTLAAVEGPDTAIRVWDVGCFKKSTSPTKEMLEKSDRESLWADLASGDAAKAYQAIWTFVGSPKQAIPWLSEHLQAVPAADEKQLTKLIADLESDHFPVRDNAMRALEKHGESAAPALRKSLTASVLPETRQRIASLIKRLESFSSVQLRLLRAVEALEYAATSEAIEILKRLAGGVAEARVTQAAQASLQRLKGRY